MLAYKKLIHACYRNQEPGSRMCAYNKYLLYHHCKMAFFCILDTRLPAAQPRCPPPTSDGPNFSGGATRRTEPDSFLRHQSMTVYVEGPRNDHCASFAATWLIDCALFEKQNPAAQLQLLSQVAITPLPTLPAPVLIGGPQLLNWRIHIALAKTLRRHACSQFCTLSDILGANGRTSDESSGSFKAVNVNINGMLGITKPAHHILRIQA